MPAPNFAYAFGTTPPTGGKNALIQAIKTFLLGVSTTVAAAVSSTGSQAVTPAAMGFIGTGAPLWINWGLSDQECVSVTSVTGSTFTANFTKTHTGGFTVTTGLPTIGVSSPWTFQSYALSLLAGTVYSTVPSSLGDVDFTPIMIGSNATANTVGLATADDIDTSGSNGAPRQAVNWTTGTGINNCLQVQDASFSYWMVCCEFGICIAVNVAGTYSFLYCGSTRTAQPQNMRGVGASTGAIASAATSVVIAPDVSSRISVGQQVLVVNNSHNSGSTNYTQAPVLLTVASVTSGGTNCTIGFTTSVGHNFDSGALVGSLPTKISATGVTADAPSSTLMSRNNDGTWSTAVAQTATWDTGVITSIGQANADPTLQPNSLWFGEIDAVLYQNSGTVKGPVGYVYGVHLFPKGAAAQLDAFGDPSIASVWKVFLGGTNAICFGPLLNPANTQTNMQPIASTPWVP